MITTCNTLEHDGHTYTLDDCTRRRELAEFGLGADWYGGRASWIAETDGDVLLIVDRSLRVIDTAVEEAEEEVSEEADDEPEPVTVGRPSPKRRRPTRRNKRGR